MGEALGSSSRLHLHSIQKDGNFHPRIVAVLVVALTLRSIALKLPRAIAITREVGFLLLFPEEKPDTEPPKRPFDTRGFSSVGEDRGRP